jgi:hypothetical protein
MESTTVKSVYSFVVATTPLLDLKTDIGKALFSQCHAYSCEQLSAGDAEFKRLYDQVDNNNPPHTLGCGVAGSAEAFAPAFSGWLEQQGLNLKADNKKIALFSGDAQNPNDGSAFQWCVFIYFDLSD